jgi:hypothetical protein
MDDVIKFRNFYLHHKKKINFENLFCLLPSIFWTT